jgi:hypothetical protein
MYLGYSVNINSIEIWIKELVSYYPKRYEACALAFKTHQSIDIHRSIIFLYYECQLIWIFNERSIDDLVLANQNLVHVHARAHWHIFIHKYKKIYIIYLCYKYQLNWSFDEWFTCICILIIVIQNECTAMYMHVGNFRYTNLYII